AALLWGAGLRHPAHGEPQQAVDGFHPLRVSASQVVVDRQHVHRAAPEPDMTVRGDRRGEGLPLAGSHLRHPAVQQRHGAEQLHVVRPLPEAALGRLPAERANVDVAAGFLRCGGQRGVVERRQLLLTSLNGRQQLPQRRQVDGGTGALKETLEPGLQPLRHTHVGQRYAMSGGSRRPPDIDWRACRCATEYRYFELPAVFVAFHTNNATTRARKTSAPVRGDSPPLPETPKAKVAAPARAARITRVP